MQDPERGRWDGGQFLRRLRLAEIEPCADLDDPSTTEVHRQILAKKPFLRRLYEDFYRTFSETAVRGEPGITIELGSGGGFLKQVLPNTITTDVLAVREIDLRCSALALPFRDGAVKAFFLLNVFHHIGDSARALRELSRCLRAGGRVVMIEPSLTIWGRFIWRHFHHEPLDPHGPWGFSTHGPLSSANSALPWIVFCRDRRRFLREWPEFRIVSIREHTFLLYLLSGGFTLRTLVPEGSYALFQGLESLLSPLRGFLGLFQTIVLEKRESLRPGDRSP